MNLSKDFTLAELTKSSTALRLGIDNNPDSAQIDCLKALAKNILQPIRDEFGPYRVSSGFRCLELNRELRSKDTSQHIMGQAADFEVHGIDNYELACWINQEISFDKLILEFYTKGKPSSGWVHCSHRAYGNRIKCLTISNGKTQIGLIA